MIRREPFGGIIFDEFTYNKIYKLDKYSFRVVELFSQNIKAEDILKILQKDFKLHLEISELKRFLDHLSQNFRKEVMIHQSGCQNDIIWNTKWNGTHLSAPVTIYWTFTNLCNLHCTHCAWESGKILPNELSTDECKKVIDELARIGVRYISFSGGEPLTKKEQLLKIANYAKNIGLSVGLATNATLVDEKTAKELKKIDFVDVQISMEGLEAHNKIRGGGIYDKTINGTKLLIKEGVPCTFAVAINKTNRYEVDNIIRLSRNIGVKKIRFVRFIPIGRGKKNYDLFELNMREELELAIELWQKRRENINEGMIITFNKQYVNAGLLYKPELASVTEQQYTSLWAWDCPAGRVIACIMPNGSVSSCPLLGSLGLYGGNVRTSSFSEIWNNSNLFNIIRKEKRNVNVKCRDCKFWSLCVGGCKASSYAYFDELMAPDRLCFIDLMEDS